MYHIKIENGRLLSNSCNSSQFVINDFKFSFDRTVIYPGTQIHLWLLSFYLWFC